MRYDVEVSGFPSSHCGHLCLLRLKEDDYPGTTKIEEWPSWDLPVLKWGKEQGGVVGYSHSGWGLQVPATSLPTYDMPPFDGIGANEYIVDVVHDVCDFISAVDTPFIWEMNIWYHTLNCGYTCRISGETDFPCIYGERVGLGPRLCEAQGRQEPAARLRPVGPGHPRRAAAIAAMACAPVRFQGRRSGRRRAGAGGRASVLSVKAGEKLPIRVSAGGFAEEKPREISAAASSMQNRTGTLRAPAWRHAQSPRRAGRERPGRGDARDPGRRQIKDLTFEFTPPMSSWVALRIFAAAHTNPVFVEVDDKPIRASRRSAQWCLDAVDVCWKQKVKNTREPEHAAAAAAYEKAREAYRKVLAESQAD